MIVVDVNDQNDNWHQWWRNFRDYYWEQGVDMDNEGEITRALAEWNAIDDGEDTPTFHFLDEKDYMLFMLRWQ